jgi:two-component system, chemotaxis family, chemotaxis protein CheY
LGATANILVVEDDFGFRETLHDVLVEEGYEVSVAQNGAEALEVLSRLGRPLLILLDLQLPVMDGLVFLGRLGDRPDRGDLEVVVMSAGVNVEALQMGAEVIRALKKPFERSELLTLVADFAHRFGRVPLPQLYVGVLP